MTKPKTGIAVDGACSGNPGPAEYRIVDIATNKILFERKIGIGTNNHAEFIGLCDAISKFPNETIYTDSLTAISWVFKRKVNSKHYHKEIDKWIDMLKKISKFPNIVKWETKKFGEIPADFGRK
jgi:ribonuclease HI